MKIKELLDVESKWTQGVNARDQLHQSVEVHHPNARQWCLLGAVHKCYSGDMFTLVWNRIRSKVSNYFPHRWNDDPKRTFAEVRALVVELDI